MKARASRLLTRVRPRSTRQSLGQTARGLTVGARPKSLSWVLRSPTLDFFRELGQVVLRRWESAHYDEDAFPEVAASVLATRPPSAHVDPMEVIRWVHGTPDLMVPQADPNAHFGEPPISVFACERFFIQVLFWVDGTTTLHHHGFSGAFNVLRGPSIHSTFGFETTKRYGETLLLGRLTLRDVELLKDGDVRTITAGPAFVHSLFHCSRPSVSVVIRTRTHRAGITQLNYLRSGIAYDPFFRNESAARKAQTLKLLHDTEHREYKRTALTALRKSDPVTAFHLLLQLDRWMGARFGGLLDKIGTRRSPVVDAIRKHAEERRREDRVIGLRRLTADPELRFFLAVLLNVRDRKRVLEIVRSAFPRKRPAETIVGWLNDLSRPNAILDWTASLATKSSESMLFDRPLDELSKRILVRLLEGADLAQVAHSREPHVRQRSEELRRSPLLGHLL